MKSNIVLGILLTLVLFFSCEKTEIEDSAQVQHETLVIVDTVIYSTVDKKSEPLFPNSVVSNDIDFITATDADAFETLRYVGTDDKEMPGHKSEILFDKGTFVFEARFTSGQKLAIWCHSDFGTETLAREYAEKVCPRLGKLPEVQRSMLTRVVIHKDDRVAFAETEGRFFVLFSENIDQRISTHDLEETIFHESVHASLQSVYEETLEWKLAQIADGNYITEYAKKKPALEDMPESALFAYIVIKYPGRLPSDIEQWVKDYMPNRLAFFRSIYS